MVPAKGAKTGGRARLADAHARALSEGAIAAGFSLSKICWAVMSPAEADQQRSLRAHGTVSPH